MRIHQKMSPLLAASLALVLWGCNSDQVEDGADKAAAGLDRGGAAIERAGEKLGQKIEHAGEGTKFENAAHATGAGIEKAGEKIHEGATKIGDKAKEVAPKVGGAVEKAGETIKDLGHKAGETAKELGTKIKEEAKDLKDKAVDTAKDLKDKAKVRWPKTLPRLLTRTRRTEKPGAFSDAPRNGAPCPAERFGSFASCRVAYSGSRRNLPHAGRAPERTLGVFSPNNLGDILDHVERVVKTRPQLSVANEARRWAMDRAGAKVSRGVSCPECELELDGLDGRGSAQGAGHCPRCGGEVSSDAALRRERPLSPASAAARRVRAGLAQLGAAVARVHVLDRNVRRFADLAAGMRRIRSGAAGLAPRRDRWLGGHRWRAGGRVVRGRDQ